LVRCPFPCPVSCFTCSQIFGLLLRWFGLWLPCLGLPVLLSLSLSSSYPFLWLPFCLYSFVVSGFVWSGWGPPPVLRSLLPCSWCCGRGRGADPCRLHLVNSNLPFVHNLETFCVGNFVSNFVDTWQKCWFYWTFRLYFGRKGGNVGRCAHLTKS